MMKIMICVAKKLYADKMWPKCVGRTVDAPQVRTDTAPSSFQTDESRQNGHSFRIMRWSCPSLSWPDCGPAASTGVTPRGLVVARRRSGNKWRTGAPGWPGQV